MNAKQERHRVTNIARTTQIRLRVHAALDIPWILLTGRLAWVLFISSIELKRCYIAYCINKDVLFFLTFCMTHKGPAKFNESLFFQTLTNVQMVPQCVASIVSIPGGHFDVAVMMDMH